MEKGNVKKASSLMMCAVFVGFLLFFAVGYIALQPDSVSYFENRTLAPRPSLTFDSLKDGTFAEDTEKYLSDHIVMRNALVSLSTEMNYFLGKRSLRSVYYGSGGRLFLKFFRNDSAVTRLCKEYNAFAEKTDVPIDYILVPSAGMIYSDQLPAGTDCVSCEEQEIELIKQGLDSRINLICPLDALRQLADSGVKTYLNTDHHWTVHGAKAVMEHYLNSIGRPLRKVDYKKESISGYYGPMFANFPSYSIAAEDVEYLSDPEGKYTVEQPFTGETDDKLFYTKYMLEWYKYGVFLDGDKGYIHIHSENAPEGSIMVIKDSFGLAFMTLLADQYRDIYAVDVRHYDKSRESISQLTREVGAERVLIVNMTYSIINSEMFGLS